MFSENEELKRKQSRSLGIFQSFQKVCEEHNLHYYLSGGTLLGCVRHEGFIPWDDDMDIAMPREDYEALIKIANRFLPDYYRLDHFSLCSENDMPLTHHVQIVDTRTEMTKSWTVTQRKTSVWIDVFPLDGLPMNAVRRKAHLLHGRFWWLIMQLTWFKDNVNIKKNRPFPEKVVISALMHLPAAKSRLVIKVLNRFDRTAKKYPFTSSDKICSFHGTYGSKELLDREWYEKSTTMPFEGIPCNIPSAYDKVLKHYYGSYEIPKEEKNRHECSVIKL